MTFLESGKEYQSIRSYKGLNFRDGCLTFGVPLWHDLCSSSPNISGVNLSVCLWHYNSPCCLHAEEKQGKATGIFSAFYRCHNETKARFNCLFREKVPLQMWQGLLIRKKTHKPPSKTRVRSSFPMHWNQPCVDAEAETRGRNEKCYLWTGE